MTAEAAPLDGGAHVEDDGKHNGGGESEALDEVVPCGEAEAPDEAMDETVRVEDENIFMTRLYLV